MSDRAFILNSRLSPSGSGKRQLAEGPPLSVSDQRLLGGLASAESRILGSAQLGKMRDVAIGLLRVTTLLAAVLLGPFKEDTSEPKNAEKPAQPQIVVIPVQPGRGEGPGPTDSPVEQVTVNLKVEGVAAKLNGDDVAHVEVIDHKPLTLFKTGTLVLGASRGYWYRTELGAGDYFWALPDGDFSFQVIEQQACGGAAADVCAVLEFQFDTRAATQNRLGTLPLRRSSTGVATPGADQVGDRGAVDCDGGKLAGSILRCAYSNAEEDDQLIVWVKASEKLADDAGKTALDVRWCRSSELRCVPAPAINPPPAR